MQKPAQLLSLLLSQLTGVLALPPGSLMLSDEACSVLSPFTMILCPGFFFSLEHLHTCFLLEQPCVGDLRELSLRVPELVMQNMWQEVAAFLPLFGTLC